VPGGFKRWFGLAGVGVVLLVGPGLCGASESPTNRVARPAQWAQPVTVAGVPNLYRVSSNLFRSAQPSAEGMSNLKAMGVRTVVNLRAFHSDRDEVAGTGLFNDHIAFKSWHPEDEDVVRFLKLTSDTNNWPILVHCQHGADRTGTMCALYRVLVEGWSKEEAIREMTGGGYGFHPVWKNLLRYIRELDTERIRESAHLTPTPRRTPQPAE
jgi:protein tyrosine/serine phosphatase